MKKSESNLRLKAGLHRRAAFRVAAIGALTLVAVQMTARAFTMLNARAFATVNAGLLSSMATAQASFAGQPERNAEIVKTVDAYPRAVLAGDATAVAAMYVDDAIELPPGDAPVEGRAAIERHYRTLFEGPVKVTAFTFSHLASTAEGNVAYDAGTYERSILLPSGQTVSCTGKYLVVLRRVENQWKAMYVIYNVDNPAC